jgi:macrolide transport system ATP-binding/permease protein
MNEIAFRDRALAQTAPLIELDNVGKTFVTGSDVHVDALRGISLSIYPGEFVAIMGASGSGKSTLMNILGCLDRPSAGAYRFSGRDVSQFDSDSLAWLRREAFGFIFQSYNLLPTSTAEENVEIPAIYSGVALAERRKRATGLLDMLGLADRLTHRPNQLSGGQQQRVSIARALMNGGRILLADEPTGALDSKTGAEVMALLEDLAAEGHTVILITHDPNVAKHAHRVIELRDGLIVHDSGIDRSRSAAAPSPVEMPSLAAMHETHSSYSGLSEALRMALRALHANLFRTLLTLLGIVIGVASVVTMLALGEGAKDKVIAQIGQMGTNILVILPQYRTNVRGYNGPVATLNMNDSNAISHIPYVTSVLPEVQGAVTVRYGDIDYQTQVDSTTNALPEIRSWPVAEGLFFSEDEQQSYATVAVLGQTVKNVLFPDGSDPLGKYVLVNNLPFRIIGVMGTKGANMMGQDADDVVFVPLTSGMLRVFGQRFLRSITVTVSDLSQMSRVQDQITALVKDRHRGQEDFQIRNIAEVLDTVNQVATTITLLLGSVAAISLLVGGIGIMNIMLVSVTERTREIGIRMATGARKRDILQQFLSEAVAVSAIGGLIGLGLAVCAGLLIRALGQPVAFTPGPMLLAFGCAAGTGLIFGFAPARKAAQLDPVVALANE